MRLLFAAALLVPTLLPASPAQTKASEELLMLRGGDIGRRGGRLVIALRSEPRTLNPAIATDGPSREVIGTMVGDLIHINRRSQTTEPSLASQWTVSNDGRQYTLRLRTGIRFSDGHPADADDVAFTFRALLDEKVHAPQRDLLIVGGQPIAVDTLDSHTVRVTLAQPYAAAERLFDGIAILPRHLLQQQYEDGSFARAWPLTTAPATMAGLGPFRLKTYVPGQHLVLERNPYYWKADREKQRLPYVDEVVFLFAGTEDGQVIRFQSGETHVLHRIGPENFSVLARDQPAKGFVLDDLGPGLEYNFVLFNLNDLSNRLPQIAAVQAWFRDVRFRRAISLAIDRPALVRLAYRNRAMPLWGHVTEGNTRWVNRALPHPSRSLEQARSLLRAAGFSWRSDGSAIDAAGRPIVFSLAVSSTNAQRMMMATLIQDDLKPLGISVRVVSLEFRALLDRVFQSFDYETCILGLGGGDADPNSEMNVWLSRGSSHLWSLGQKAPLTPWEEEIDRLMERQLITRDFAERKRLYDRVQQLVAEHLPLIPLASPNVLVAARPEIGNFRPAVLDHPVLWNVDELFVRSAARRSDR